MEWLETIHLQTADGLETIVRNQILEFTARLHESSRPFGLLSVRVYYHASLMGDLMVKLKWETDCPLPSGSREGLGIKDAIRRHGLIDHNIWLPAKEEDSEHPKPESK